MGATSRLPDHQGSYGKSWRNPRGSLLGPSLGLLSLTGPFVVTGRWKSLLLLLHGRMALGENRDAVIILRTTISSSVSLASALDELTDSSTTCSVVGTLVRCSSINVCKVWP